MTKPERYLPGTYITDGRSLFWVVERETADTLLVENAVSGEQIVVGDADLQGYRKVESSERTENDDDQQ